MVYLPFKDIDIPDIDLVTLVFGISTSVSLPIPTSSF
jgi:hypothetical protein